MMAVIVSGAMPTRASRATVSRTPKPQSISRRVVPASTSRPFPSLPLPRQAKRTLLELILEQREDLLAVRRAVHDAGGILHRHQAAGIGLRHHNPVLFRLFRLLGLPELDLGHRIGEPAFRFFLRQVRIRIADEIKSLRTVAIDDGEAGAIERESDAAPRQLPPPSAPACRRRSSGVPETLPRARDSAASASNSSLHRLPVKSWSAIASRRGG